MNEVYEFLKKCNVYYIATIKDNKPTLRPFGTVDIFDNELTIQTGKIKEVSKQIHKNPNIEICAFDGQQWLRLEATAVEDTRIEAQVHMLDAYPNLKAMYAVGDGNTEIFKLTNCKARFCSFVAPEKVIEF